MKKYITLFWVFIANFIALSGQPQTARGTVVSAHTDPLTGTYSVVGQPFYRQVVADGYEYSYGVAQAQLETVFVNDETCVNEPYTENGFDIPTSEMSVGSSNYEQYTINAAPLGYDRLAKLVLVVWPTYASEDTVMYYGLLPVIDGSEMKNGEDYHVVEGDNIINFRTIHGCDSVVTLHASLCPYTVKDADSNLYNTLILDNFCWTKSNMRTTHYFGNAHVAVPFSKVYHSYSSSLNVAELEETFGRLYTWYSAVNIPEESDANPPLDSDGFVRGICPAGWHLPAEPETEALFTHTADELQSSDFWLTGGGLNTTGFTLLPAGKYNSSTERFEGLLTDAYFWKISGSSFSEPIAFCTAYYCGVLMPVPDAYPLDAFSVRCVKNY